MVKTLLVVISKVKLGYLMPLVMRSPILNLGSEYETKFLIGNFKHVMMELGIFGKDCYLLKWFEIQVIEMNKLVIIL